MNKKWAVCIHSAFYWPSLEIPFGSGNKHGVDGHPGNLEVARLVWEGHVELWKSQSPGPVIYKMFKNWHISLNLSELQFCHLYSKLFQRISVTIK